MQIYFWAQKEHLEDEQIRMLMEKYDIQPFIRYDSPISYDMAHKIAGTTIADGREFPNVKAMTYYFDEVFTNGDFGRYNQHLKKWISHPTKPKWFIMQPTIWGDTAICFIKKLIKAGAQSITYTAYKQHLFRIFGVNIINPFRNQIPTWEKLMKKYPREFNFAWIHIEQVKDFKKLINWCKLNRIERVGICSSIESLSVDEHYTNLKEFEKILKLAL